jgi:hypothetical protein
MIFTGAVALFTLLLVGATVMLYLAGDKQLRFAREAGKRQSDEMQKSIAVADAANELNRRNALNDRRPWVAIDGVKFRESFVFEDAGASATFDFNLKNVGKSPALKVFGHLQIGVRNRTGAKPVADEQSAFLAELLLRKYPALSTAIFPNEIQPDAIAASVMRSEIDDGAIETNIGKFIYFTIWIGVGYESNQGDFFYTVTQYWIRGLTMDRANGDLTISHMSSHAI